MVAVDVGAVRRGNFGWSAVDVLDGGENRDRLSAGEGRLPSEAVDAVTEALAERRRVALGVECPLFVPVPDDEQDLGKARCGESGPGLEPRPWAAGAGSGALATGTAQLPWLLARIRARTPVPVTTRPERWCSERPLLLWEAFVAAGVKASAEDEPHGGHVGDARLAVEAFLSLGSGLYRQGTVHSHHPVFNLAAAAATAVGLTIGPVELGSEMRVARAE